MNTRERLIFSRPGSSPNSESFSGFRKLELVGVFAPEEPYEIYGEDTGEHMHGQNTHIGWAAPVAVIVGAWSGHKRFGDSASDEEEQYEGGEDFSK